MISPKSSDDACGCLRRHCRDIEDLGELLFIDGIPGSEWRTVSTGEDVACKGDLFCAYLTVLVVHDRIDCGAEIVCAFLAAIASTTVEEADLWLFPHKGSPERPGLGGCCLAVSCEMLLRKESADGCSHRGPRLLDKVVVFITKHTQAVAQF